MEKSELEQKFLSLVDSYKQVIYKVCFMYATDDKTISDLKVVITNKAGVKVVDTTIPLVPLSEVE